MTAKMAATRPGEAGVVAWCNSIRFTMAQDPVRQSFHDEIQSQGFDFIDSYLENLFNVPKKDSVMDLLKTPGRKKGAPLRTRGAASVVARNNTVVSISLEEGEEKENTGRPINEFHKALLRVKGQDAPSLPSAASKSSHQRKDEESGSRLFSAQFKNQRIVTIADSPAVVRPDAEDRMAVDEPEPLPALAIEANSPKDEISTNSLAVSLPNEPIAELSVIAEDDESVERSRSSILPHHPTQRLSEAKGTDFGPMTVDPEPQACNEEHASSPHPEDLPEVDKTGDVTSLSMNTFHSIPLNSPELTEPTPSTGTVDYHTAPLPIAPTSSGRPQHRDEDRYTAPLPPVSTVSHEEPGDVLVPTRDEPSVPVPGLSRMASLSALRKSVRLPSEGAGSSVPTATFGTGVPAMGGKRTSWLTKAKELDHTLKRASTTLGLGLNVPAPFTSNKRKSGEMLDLLPGATSKMPTDDGRAVKAPKLDSTEEREQSAAQERVHAATTPFLFRKPSAEPVGSAEKHQDLPTTNDDDDVGLYHFKKTVEGFGATRAGKSMGKSLGGNAAAALAEARAAAEARIAERNKMERGSEAAESPDKEGSSTHASPEEPVPMVQPSPTGPKEDSRRRLSVSDLVSSSERTKEKQPAAVFQAAVAKGPPPVFTLAAPTAEADTSTSTTPPTSPPRVAPRPEPVFSKPKPPAVFVPPVPAPSTCSLAPTISRDYSFKLPTTNPFSLPVATTLGVGSKVIPLTAQSSKSSVFSDAIFDQESSVPAWMTSTQETSFSTQPNSQLKDDQSNDDLDDDDSWHVDEKFASNQMWTPFGFTSGEKDDTNTWSTLPSRSTSHKGGDTAAMQFTTAHSLFSSIPEGEQVDAAEVEVEVEETNFASRLAAAANDPDEDMDLEADIAMQVDDLDDQDQVEDELEDIILTGKSTVNLVQPHSQKSDPPEGRSDSQQSMISTSSSQSNLGFLGQATKFVSSYLGASKKGKEPVKSIQRAAAAAKKQIEEAEKKAARLKEMENRRQLAQQRKADEEKARAMEEERKIKEEAERRRREREDHTDKRPLSRMATTKKAEDDTRKVKVVAPPSTKPPSKEKKDNLPPRTIKPPAANGPGSTSKPAPALKSALRQPTVTASSSSASIPSAKATVKTLKAVQSSSTLNAAKGKEKAAPRDDHDEQPAKVVQSQMADRAKAHMQAQLQQPPPVTSESIELPDINSEYSDSDDEDRPRTFAPPDWAQSPHLRDALEQQSTLNPDDIFGPIGPLRMEEIFRTRQSRFRARTSSANWAGTDELTEYEEREYARRMGFR